MTDADTNLANAQAAERLAREDAELAFAAARRLQHELAALKESQAVATASDRAYQDVVRHCHDVKLELAKMAARASSLEEQLYAIHSSRDKTYQSALEESLRQSKACAAAYEKLKAEHERVCSEAKLFRDAIASLLDHGECDQCSHDDCGPESY